MKGGVLPTLISSFDGPWNFLSNFYPVPVKLWIGSDGMVWAGSTHYAAPDVTYTEEEYTSTEHAYQAAKFLNAELRERFRYEGLTPGQAKRLGANLKSKVRKDWHQVQLAIMRDLLAQKFTYSILKRKLLSTFMAELIEGNTWHDNFFGNCVCDDCVDIPGENWLGKLLMELRRSYIS